MKPAPDKQRHNHGEAFMVMTYECKAGHQFEIWNSRDGVTPFGVGCRTPGCSAPATHVNWPRDRYEPNHQLKPGDWFFRDGTPEEARAIVRRRLEQARGTEWERPESEWDDVIKGVTEGHEFQPGWPMLVQSPGADTKEGRVTLWASSGYGGKSRQPFVSIHWKDVMQQLSLEDARRFARSIYEAAEAAEQDAFIFEWVKEATGADDAGAANLLHEYRRWRERRRMADGM